MKKIFVVVLLFISFIFTVDAASGTSLETAIFMEPGETYTLSWNSNVDFPLYLKFEVDRPSEIMFNASKPVGGSVSNLDGALSRSYTIRFLSGNGEILASNYNMSGYGNIIYQNDIFSYFIGLPAGTYYVSLTPNFVSNSGSINFVYNYGRFYSNYVEQEPNNTQSTAQDISFGGEYEGFINNTSIGNDAEDWYRIYIPAGQKVRIYMSNLDGLNDFYGVMELLDPYMKEHPISFKEYLNYDSFINKYFYSFTAMTSGYYYLRVFNYAGMQCYYTFQFLYSGVGDEKLIEEVSKDAASGDNSNVVVYRLYNPNSGEHLYTTDSYEVLVLTREQGWGYEGVAWYAPKSGIPVYRLYQPQLGNHLYTSDLHEIDVITRTQGWVLDFDGNSIMYSGGSVPIYRLFNPSLNGQHHLTTDANEYRVLPSQRWIQEGIALYSSKVGSPRTTHYYRLYF